MHNEFILLVKNLKKHFAVGGGFLARGKGIIKAVDGVDFSVRKGETFGIVGESGCGKTTLGRCILRLEEPTEGEIHFMGKDVLLCDQRTLRSLRQEMQIIFQDPFSSLNPRKRVGELIGEGLKVHRVLSKRERQARVEELVDLVGLRPEILRRYPHEFSGGQRQRICIARALALNPKLMIADEPVSALDVSIQAQILNVLVELQRRFNLTYIFISHDLRIVRHLCDRVAVMYFGRIVELSEARKLFEQPLHPYTMALLSSVPKTSPSQVMERIQLQGEVPSQLNPPAGCSFYARCARRQHSCAETVPPLREHKQGHFVACHIET